MISIQRFFSLVLIGVLLHSCSSQIEIDEEYYNSLNIETQVISHRGYWMTAGSAQNSITAVKKSIERNIDGVEIDVQMSSDGILYLCHDPSFRGYIIKETPSTVLDKLKLSNGENFVRFDDFIEVAKENKRNLYYIEIKESGIISLDKAATESVIEKIVEAELTNQTVILSFGLHILNTAKLLLPEIKTMYLINSLKKLKYAEIKASKINIIGLNYKLIGNSDRIVKEIISQRLDLNLWTVNELDLINRLKNYPILSITTDFPAEVKDIYKDK